MNSTQPILVTVVTAPACHFCADAHDALAELAAEYPLTVTVVPAASPAGQAAARQHRADLFPLILVDGAFFSAGRLPRRKLARLLAERAPAPRCARARTRATPRPQHRPAPAAQTDPHPAMQEES